MATRSQIKDVLDKRDRTARKLGESAARKYLRSKEQPPTRGNIRAGIAFAALTITMLVIVMAL